MPKIAGAGEAVGVIVVEKRERDGNEEDGECREILAGRPSVSVRRGIAWVSLGVSVLVGWRGGGIDTLFYLLNRVRSSGC